MICHTSCTIRGMKKKRDPGPRFRQEATVETSVPDGSRLHRHPTPPFYINQSTRITTEPPTSTIQPRSGPPMGETMVWGSEVRVQIEVNRKWLFFLAQRSRPQQPSTFHFSVTLPTLSHVGQRCPPRPTAPQASPPPPSCSKAEPVF